MYNVLIAYMEYLLEPLFLKNFTASLLYFLTQIRL